MGQLRLLVRLLALLLGLGAAPGVLAQALPFAGRWVLDEQTPAAAAYTVLNVGDGTMTWRGAGKAAPRCVQEFVVKAERPGTVYVDGRGIRYLAGVKGSIPTYLLQVRSSSCGPAGEDVRIRYPLVYDTRHIELIEYVNGKPVSSRRLRRKK